ncbi:hypothetical protein BKA69DRAFT_831386 [Paraphysoderma sedebokerense]|nr:hypothetical protein BKA69DRAFT_831386 [Paraphysoderma sedebokerense]
MTFDGNLRMGGRSVFSYPYGGASSFTAESFEQIKSLFRSWFCPLETRAEPLGPRVPLRPQGFKAPSKEEGQLEPIETMTEEEIAEMLKDMERERLLALSEAGLADADKAVAPVSSSSAKVWEIDPEPIETMTEEETAEMLKDMERERLLALSEAGLADADKAVAPVSSSSLTMCELDPELIQTMTEEETAEMLKDMERERLLALSEAGLADADKAVAPVSSSSLTMCELDPELIQTMTEEETAEMLKDMERERLSAVGKVETAEVGKAVASDHRVYSFSLKRPELLSDDELDYIARMKSEDFMVKFNIAEDNVRPYMSSIQYEVTRRISGC